MYALVAVDDFGKLLRSNISAGVVPTDRKIENLVPVKSFNEILKTFGDDTCKKLREASGSLNFVVINE